MKAQQSFEYKGYTLVQQLKYNFHYMIFDSNGKYVLHASCTKKIKSQKEAESYIQHYLDCCERLSSKILEDKDDEE